MPIVCCADNVLPVPVVPILCYADSMLCHANSVSCQWFASANVMQVLMVCCSSMDVMPLVVVLIVCANAMPRGCSPLYVLPIVCCANSGLKYVGPSNT